MKYYIEYKDKEEFDALCIYYKSFQWSYINPKAIGLQCPPGFIIENDVLDWRKSSDNPPTDAKKITFQEWKEMVYLENKLNPKLEWKSGAYVKYLGTKSGKNSGSDWENYFNQPGLKAGDVGIISTYYNNSNIFIRDNIRSNSNGHFNYNDLQLITKEEYEAGLRDSTTKTYEFNEGDLVVVTKWCGKTDYFNDCFKPGEIIKLGGQYWTTYTRDSIDSFKNLPFISKKSINGNAFSNQTDTKFRHCTPEEIAYYNKVGMGANINNMKKEEPKSDLPFKIGDEVTILSNPGVWSSALGGKFGLNSVIYPYTFIVRNIKNVYNDNFISILDDNYGWSYNEDNKHLFVKAESKEDNSWKIAVKTDDECKDRPHMIDYLLSLHKYATNNKRTLVGYDANTHYYLIKDNNDSKPYITTSCKLPKGYKVIEEKDLPNYPKTKTFEVPHGSPLDLKFVVKSSMNVLKLLDKLKGYEHHYENYGFGYKYINYPFYDGSHLCDSIPSGYVEISEHEAIDRLTSIINGTFLIRTRPSVHVGISNGNPDTYSNTTVFTKKQSLTEQLCKIIKKEPVNTPVTSLFPSKRKSIINKLKF